MPDVENGLLELFFDGEFLSQKNSKTYAKTVSNETKLLDMSALPMSHDVMIAFNEFVPMSAFNFLFKTKY